MHFRCSSLRCGRGRQSPLGRSGSDKQFGVALRQHDLRQDRQGDVEGASGTGQQAGRPAQALELAFTESLALQGLQPPPLRFAAAQRADIESLRSKGGRKQFGLPAMVVENESDGGA